jgi:hypothetical protein
VVEKARPREADTQFRRGASLKDVLVAPIVIPINLLFDDVAVVEPGDKRCPEV